MKKGGHLTAFYCVYYTTKIWILQFLILFWILFILDLNYKTGDKL